MTHRMYKVPLTAPGRLWLMAAPPPKQLNEVVAQCKRNGIAHVVSLLEIAEAAALGLADEETVCDGAGIHFAAFPIIDFGLPETGFDVFVAKLSARLHVGEGVAIHCRAGIGRTGTTANCLPQALGHDSQAAMKMVGDARRITIPDTQAQRAFIEAFGERIRS